MSTECVLVEVRRAHCSQANKAWIEDTAIFLRRGVDRASARRRAPPPTNLCVLRDLNLKSQGPRLQTAVGQVAPFGSPILDHSYSPSIDTREPVSGPRLLVHLLTKGACL